MTMILKDRFSEIRRYIDSNCTAHDYTLSMHSSRKADIRFAQNCITQNIAGDSISINLQAAFGASTGSASVNQWDTKSLQYLMDTACEIARYNEEDPEYMPGSSYIELPDIENFHVKTAELEPAEMVSNIANIVEFARNRKGTASGLISKEILEYFTASKNGFYADDRISIFKLSTTLKKAELETNSSQSYLDYSNFKMNDFIKKLDIQYQALQKTQQRLPAGRYNVILKPSSVFQLITFMGYFMDQKLADRGLSAFSNRLGTQIAGRNFSLSSTIIDRDLIAVSNFYNAEPARDIHWIKEGVLSNLSLDRFYAKKTGKSPCYPFNIFIKGGNSSDEDMIKKVKKGLIINDLWYLSNVDTKKGEITGMTRNGVLYFEDGEIKYPVNNFRFSEIPLEVYSRIIAMAPEELFNIRAKIPAMLIQDFNFVDTTSF